jgi:selenocysteine lyase/cysteine desulfurase
VILAAPDWTAIRREFDLELDRVNLAGMVVASHPRTVRNTIDHHRKALDRQPWPHIVTSLHSSEAAACQAVSDYFGVDAGNVALTSSTTEGLALLYSGLRVAEGEEIVHSAHEFSAVKEILKLRRRRDNARIREIRLYKDSVSVTPEEVLGNLDREINAKTKVLAVTWVNSGDGVKLPIDRIASLVQERNAKRKNNPIRLCVDGVHGLGIENTTFDRLGCDFLAAGCHKSVFGPRGTGITCGEKNAWKDVVAVVPTFSDRDAGPAREHSPGGLHAYEHRWALAEAFRFLASIGKEHIANRIGELARLAKSQLEAAGALLRTPRSEAMSSGIVCFDARDSAGQLIDSARVVAELQSDGVLATQSSTTANNEKHVRWSVSIFNNEEEIERAVRTIRRLAS